MLSINDISIITVTFNSEKIIKKFLLQSELENFNQKKIIIVDNNSNDKTINTIKNIGKKYKIIQNIQNFGYGKGVNIGMTAVKSKYCLIVNPDLIFENFFFTKLLNGIERNTGFGLIAPRLSKPIQDKGVRHEDKTTAFISGACFLIDCSILKNKVFDEKIFLFYEDNILSDRIINLGYKLILLGDCSVHHEGENSTQKNSSIQKLRNWHMGWSEAYYLMKRGGNIHNRIFINLIVKFKRALIFLIFLKIKRFIAVYFRIKGIICYLQGIDSHERRNIGPF